MTTPHSDSRSISSAVLARYFASTATAEELAAVHAWIGDDQVRQAAIAEWREAWLVDVEKAELPHDAEAAWTRMSERLGLLTLVRSEASTRRIPPLRFALPRAASSRVRAIRWAAAAVVLIALGTTWHIVGRPVASRVAMTAAREYTTSRGQRSLLRLPDGSEVMLNVASHLRVPATFGAAGQPRALELEGQAQFLVVHDTMRPFTVRTARGVTRDVGTRFDIRAYPADVDEQVTVAEGEVAVRSDSTAGEMMLRAGDAAVLDRAGNVSVARGVDVVRAFAWTKGRLELQRVTLAEAARRLGRWYDLDVHVADAELARRLVVGSYLDEPPTQVLGIVAAAVGARVEVTGRSVTFHPRDRR